MEIADPTYDSFYPTYESVDPRHESVDPRHGKRCPCDPRRGNREIN